MNDAAGDWGLLSIADVIGEGDRGHHTDLTSSGTAVGWLDDPNIPLFSADCLGASRGYARKLVQLLVTESQRKSSNMEDLFIQKSIKSKHSLVASERIRARMITVYEFFMSYVSAEKKTNKLLASVFLIAASFDMDPKQGILEGLQHVDWKFASAPSCLELFHAITSFRNLHEDPDETFAAALFDLAVRSEHLSALVFCMNLPHSSTVRTTRYVPPPTKHFSGTAQFSAESFLPRCCEFPLPLERRRRKVRCFSCDDATIAVVSGSTVIHYNQLGMLGTRLVKVGEKIVSLLHDERIVHRSVSGVLIVRALGRRGNYWKFHFREENILPSDSNNTKQHHNKSDSNTEKECPSLLLINTEAIGNSSLVFNFSVCQEVLYCLICVNATSMVQRLCYVVNAPLNEMLSGQCEITVSGTHLLTRRAARSGSTPKSLLLTPSSSVSLGRVSLKEHFHPFCLELWVYPRNTKETQVVLSIGDKAVDEVLIEMEPSGDGLVWRGGSRTPQLGTSFASVTVPGRLSGCERWWYVVLNYTGVAWELSVDHTFFGRNSALVSPEGIWDAKCVLGRSFTGFLAEVRVWNHTRTLTESMRDARRALDGASEEGLLGYFPINEQGGHVVADYSRHAQHTFLPNGTHFWSAVKQLPVIPPTHMPTIADFLPLTQAADVEDVHFAVTPDFLCIATATAGPCVTLFYYSVETLQLTYENRTEISSAWDVKSIAYNKDKDTVLCCCANQKEENQLIMWEVHSEIMLPLSAELSFSTLWSCGRALVLNAASFVLKLVQTERYLADQITWWDLRGGVTTLAMDAHASLIPALLKLAKTAKALEDEELANGICVLLHSNVFLRLQSNLNVLHEEMGGCYPTMEDALAVLNVNNNDEERTDVGAPFVRDALFRFAFGQIPGYMGLARVCCRCFLTNTVRIGFVRSYAAKKRNRAEGLMFGCLIDFYRTLYSSHYGLESVEAAQQLYTALILESTYQLNKTFVTHDRSALLPISRCLEMFQEHLFARMCDKPDSDPFLNLLVRYTKTLFKACNNALVAIVKAIRQNNAAAMSPYDALEFGLVGTLLPSLTLSLPLLPMGAQSTLSRHMQTCRNSLATLSDSTQTVPVWVHELKTAFSFSLCLIGCSLLDTSSKPDTLSEMVMREGVSFLPLLCGGHRRAGTERDTLVKGLAAGVGPLSKAFDELLKSDNTAIRVVRDQSLRSAERQIMAALCALTVPTSKLREVDRASLEGLYVYIRKIRSNTLSQRQIDPNYVSQLEGRANFLSQFEICFHQTGEMSSGRQGSEPAVHSDMRSVTADKKKHSSMSQQQKWKNMFRNWKKIKLLKTLISTQEESDDLKKVCSSIMSFVESNLSSDVLAEAIDERVQKAKYRLSGMILLKDLCNEARVSNSLASLVLPVMAKSFYGWHYAHGVECCSNEVMYQIQSAFFQLWDIVVEQCTLDKPKSRHLWPNLFMAMAVADWRTVDIKNIRSNAAKVLHNFWETAPDPNTAVVKRCNGNLPAALRCVTISSAQCAQTVCVDRTGRIVQSLGGRSCCAAPCVWEIENRIVSYYLEVLLIDTKAGGSFSLGVGPFDYSISRLPGWDNGSVALQCDEGLLFTGSTQCRVTGHSLGNGDVVGCGWNWEKKQIFWTKNGRVIVSTEAPDGNMLSPLLGFDGRTLVQVNFGSDAFLYNDFSCGLDMHPKVGFICDAWDTFRVFSLRTVLRLADSCALQRKLQLSENSLVLSQGILDIMKPVASMLKLLANELTRLLEMMPTGARLTASLLRHITTVLQLLAIVPREPCITESCVAIGAACATSISTLFTPNRPDEEFQSLLLSAWFAAAHMVEPASHLFDSVQEGPLKEREKDGAFLYTLLRLGRYLTLTFMDQAHSNGMYVNVPDPRCAAVPESVLWLSLALLQRLNADETHAWGPLLHLWLVRSFHSLSKATPDVFLALAILGGVPRMAAMGDRVVIHRSSQWSSVANLVTFALEDGICQVVEEEKVSIVPLRLVDLVVHDDDSCYFPKKDDDRHREQMEELVPFAIRFLNEAKANLYQVSDGDRLGVGGDFFAAEAQLMKILYRAQTRKVIQLPFSFITLLKETESLWETQCTNIQVESVQLEKVLIETCRLYIMSQGARKVSSDTYSRDDSSLSSLHNTHTFYEESFPFPNLYKDTPPDARQNNRPLPVVSSTEYSSDTPPSAGSFSFSTAQRSASDLLRRGSAPEPVVDHFFFDHSSCLCVEASRVIQSDFTIDVLLRLTEANSYQLVFSQALTKRAFPKPNVLLFARILDGKMQFGRSEAIAGKERFTTDTELCFVPLENEDVGRVVRFTFTQSEKGVFVYKDGLMQDSRKDSMSAKTALLSNTLYIGGSPSDAAASFKGCMMGFRVFNVALSSEMVSELGSPSTATVLYCKSHLVLHPVATSSRGSFGNGTPQESLNKVRITVEGDVTTSQGQSGRNAADVPQSAVYCMPELDLGYANEETELFTLHGEAFVHHPTKNFVADWKTMREQTLETLQAAHHICCRQLAQYNRLQVLTQLLVDAVESKEGPTRYTTKEDVAVLRSMTRRCVSYVAYSGADSLRKKLKAAVLPDLSGREVTAAMQLTGTVVMRTLLDMSSIDFKMFEIESSHPLKPSTRCVHEVSIPGEKMYLVYFDRRCRQSNLTLSFALDSSMSSVVAQAPGLALTAFHIVLPRFFFEIRSDASNAQWGYKVYIVYNCRPQLRAMREFRWLLSNVLDGDKRTTKDLEEFVFSSQCLDQLSRCAYATMGKTRSIALSCLTEILILCKDLRNIELPSLSGVHVLRRLAEQVHRQKEPTKSQGGVLRSRFVQVVAEFYVGFQDAFRVWSALGDDKVAASLSQRVLSPAEEREAFLQRRGRERSLYVDREDAEHVGLRKWSPNQHVHFEWSTERVWTARTTRGAAALLTNSPLHAGCWYFEMRLLTAGDVYVGVAPDCKQHPMPSLFFDEVPIVFNGLTGAMEGNSDISERCCPVWGNTDIVGVVLDLDHHWCTFYVNGLPSGVTFSFGANNNKAAGATGERTREEDAVSYFPFFRLGPNEAVALNFGSTHFEYDVPPNSMPLDPSHLMLDSLVPYNQIRAFQELAAYILTKERHPLPPFYVEDTDPFEHTVERKGPAHVSMRPTEGVQMNGLDIKNVGNDFSTVVADAAVCDGQWYFEVTLQSQGLMQIGWSMCHEDLTLLEPTSVGDSASSWSIDLFRRVRWHNGCAEPLPSSVRRWSIGDVVGCALDLSSGELTFFINGHPVTNTKSRHTSSFQNVPKRAYFVPCISLRAGNNVMVNFGSNLFKFKPDGFRALGTCDSWNERIDSFFANECLYTTSQRRAVLQELYRALNPQVNNEATQEAIQPYKRIAHAVEPFFLTLDPTGRSFSHVNRKEVLAFLERKEPRLVKEMGTEKLSERLSIYVALMLVSATVIPFIPLQKLNASVTARLFLALREVIFKSYRHALIDTVLQETNVKLESFRLSINRARARSQPNSFRASVFGQTLSLVGDQHPQLFQTNKRFWNTVLLGEGAEDIGGPFREHLSEMCRELMSTNLPLFVPTPNHVHNIGTHRDAFVPAAGANSHVELSAFVFVGKLMGGCIRSGEPLSLTFPPLVWKSLCGYPITIQDLKDVDQLCVQCIEEFSHIKRHVESAEQFDQAFEMERFVTKLCDNTLKELIWNGSDVKVTYERCEEYAKALLETRLHEFDSNLHAIREGLLMVVPEMVLLLLTPEELELRVCGKADFYVEEVEKTAIFEGLSAGDRRVQLLWQALRDATPVQRRLFLRFVSGRDRLPIRLRVVPFNCQGDPDVNLPRAATCFFSLELPDYSSLEVMKQKLYYCIENCQDIDTDFNAHIADANDEPVLTLGPEETSQQGTAQNPSTFNRNPS